MTTKRNKNTENDADTTIRARVKSDLKNRVTQYRQRPDVQRSESFVVRSAIEEFLDVREMKKNEEAS
jgi:predicted transcriptional regulator